MLIAPAPSFAWAGLEWLAVAATAAALARLLTRAMRPLVAAEDAEPPERAVEIAFVAAALALWWWEVWAAGQLPATSPGIEPIPRSTAAARCAAHLVLGWLLAAAAWVDLRHRVIPDLITMPGVVGGLLWSVAAPSGLLPVPHQLPRPFAAPLIRTDVLGAFGGLRSAAVPSWLDAAPAPASLACAMAVFLGWWATCTAPCDPADLADPAANGRPGRRLRIDPRLAVLVVGVGGILCGWLRGGPPWFALVSSLIGIVVAAGLVWLTRIGASWALGQEALGFGDVTLMAMAGAWLGWQPCVLACFVAVFLGLAHGIWQCAGGRGNELPFGPSLCLGLAIVVVGWAPLWARSGDLFSRPGELAAVGGGVILLTAVALAVWRRVRGGGDSTA